MFNEKNIQFKNLVVLDHINKSLRDKSKIIDTFYTALKIYFNERPITISKSKILSRYNLGKEFYEIFALEKLEEEELSFALDKIYSTIGFEEVIEHIANFGGFEIKISNISDTNKKLTITVVSESIFDIKLFEVKLKEFIEDVLLYQNLAIEFDLIVLTNKLEFNKKNYYSIDIQNYMPVKINKILDLSI